MSGHGYSYRCEVCDGPPRWTIVRHGDAAITWACSNDLSLVLERFIRLERDDNEFSLRIAKPPTG